ncbi:MAG: ABC transporter ATP-binding protein [Syntrophotaleaceae bacterium]
MTLIEGRNLSFEYGSKQVLEDVSFRIPKGSLVALLGPNGCGKTTLLKIMLGLLPPGSGEMRLENRHISSYDRKELARRVAYVPQIHKASFAYRVLDVVLMGRLPHKGFWSSTSLRDEQLAMEALDLMGIGHLRDRPYTRISGGERQMTLIARALCQGARTFILDEPVNGLDYGNQIRLLERLAELAAEGYTFVMSTHFPDHVLWVAGQVVMLRDGRVIAHGHPDEVLNRDNLCRLYQADVEVWQLMENFRICVPERLRNRICNCPSGCKPVLPGNPTDGRIAC